MGVKVTEIDPKYHRGLSGVNKNPNIPQRAPLLLPLEAEGCRLVDVTVQAAINYQALLIDLMLKAFCHVSPNNYSSLKIY